MPVCSTLAKLFDTRKGGGMSRISPRIVRFIFHVNNSFRIDKKYWPLMPCRPARARRLAAGRARVVKRFFVIRLVDRTVGVVRGSTRRSSSPRSRLKGDGAAVVRGMTGRSGIMRLRSSSSSIGRRHPRRAA